MQESELKSISVALEFKQKIIYFGNRPRNHDLITHYAIIRIRNGLITDVGNKAAIEYTDGSGHIERWTDGVPVRVQNLFSNYTEFWVDGILMTIEGSTQGVMYE